MWNIFQAYQINGGTKNHSSLVLWYSDEDEEEGDGCGEDDEGVGQNVESQCCKPS